MGLAPAVDAKAGLAPPLPTTMDRAERARSLKAQATLIRRSIVEMIGRAGLGHIGGDFSVDATC